MAARTSTERVAALRERRRRAGQRRLQLEVQMSPDEQAFLEAMAKSYAPDRSRADVVHEALSLGLAVMALDDEEREAVERILSGEEEGEA